MPSPDPVPPPNECTRKNDCQIPSCHCFYHTHVHANTCSQKLAGTEEEVGGTRKWTRKLPPHSSRVLPCASARRKRLGTRAQLTSWLQKGQEPGANHSTRQYGGCSRVWRHDTLARTPCVPAPSCCLLHTTLPAQVTVSQPLQHVKYGETAVVCIASLTTLT